MKPSQNTGTLPEQEIIARIVLGEIELFKEITYRYNGYLYKIGRSYNFGHSDVEDLMQDTYVNAYTIQHMYFPCTVICRKASNFSLYSFQIQTKSPSQI